MDHKVTSYVISNLVTLLHDTPANSSPETASAETLGKPTEDRTRILELYFNDVYKLFIAKLSRFESIPNFQDADAPKLRSLLEELINVKGLLSD